MSPYFTSESERPVYWCPNCKAWYQRGNMNCCVAHAPGTCCHHGETRVEPPTRFGSQGGSR